MEEEKLDIKDLVDDIPDDEVEDINEEPAYYEIWIDADPDINILADSGYIDEDEARKCFEFFCASADNILAIYPDLGKRNYKVSLYYVAGEFTDVIEEREIK